MGRADNMHRMVSLLSMPPGAAPGALRTDRCHGGPGGDPVPYLRRLPQGGIRESRQAKCADRFAAVPQACPREASCSTAPCAQSTSQCSRRCCSLAGVMYSLVPNSEKMERVPV